MGDLKDPLLRIHDLGQFAYCPRSAWYHFLDPEQVGRHDENVQEARARHATVDTVSERRRPEGREWTCVPIFHRELGIRGVADRVLWREGAAVPVEHKPGRSAVIQEKHRLQLVLQGMCLEKMYSVRVDEGMVWFYDIARRASVPLDAPLRAWACALVATIREGLRTFDLTVFPRVEDARCRGCSHAENCLPRNLYGGA
ncbi:MAG: CRISPR-associated protein Cas4 [Planctomycetes bacterium]|nr:CRISPR-associated protein Cas4 [Planctomycetota bacterium]